MKRYKDIIAGGTLFLFGLAYFLMSFSIKLTYIDRIVGSRKFPQIVAVVFMLCALWIMFRGIKELIHENTAITKGEKTLFEQGIDAEASDEDIGKEGRWKTALVLISFAIFCFLLDKIGFGLTSFLYLLSQMILMDGKKQSWKSVLFYAVLSALLSIGIYYMFNTGFKLILPKANWF